MWFEVLTQFTVFLAILKTKIQYCIRDSEILPINRFMTDISDEITWSFLNIPLVTENMSKKRPKVEERAALMDYISFLDGKETLF